MLFCMFYMFSLVLQNNVPLPNKIPVSWIIVHIGNYVCVNLTKVFLSYFANVNILKFWNKLELDSNKMSVNVYYISFNVTNS